MGYDRFKRIVFIDSTGSTIEATEAMTSEFSVVKSDTRDPNTATVNVQNLRPSSRETIATDCVRVEVYAGVKHPPGLIFKGSVYDASVYRSGDFTAWMTTVQAEDTRAKMRAQTIGRQYADGVNIATALSELITAGELQPDVSQITAKLTAPVSLLGRPRDLIKKLCDLYGLRYQILDDRCICVPTDTPISETSVPYLSKETGLIGSPASEFEERGKGKTVKNIKVSAVSILNSELVPGGLVEIAARGVGSRRAPISPRATYWIKNVTHTSEGEAFDSAIVCKERV